MSGDIKHKAGRYLSDGFDLISNAFSVKLQDIGEDRFIRTQYLPEENGWLTRCLEYRDDKLISLFRVTDSCYPDKNLLLRSISTSIKLNFDINIYAPDNIFHEKYALLKHRLPAIQILWQDKVIYIFLSGNMSYDHYTGRLQIMPGEHEMIFGTGSEPQYILRRIRNLLSENIKPEPAEIHAGELTNAINTALSELPCNKDFLLAYSVKKLGFKADIPNPVFPESEVIRGMVPCKDSDNGSTTETIMYIYSKGKNAEYAKRAFKDNFVRGDKILLNSRKRREFCRMSRFRYGVCPYCKRENTWLEKTVHSSYACVHCYNKANIPSNIPDLPEYLSDIPLLLIIYLGLDIPTFDNIPEILKKLSVAELNSLNTGLLLYAACKYDLPEKHEIYRRLISQRNNVGIWHGKTYCCPTTNAVCAAAITEYKRTEDRL